RAAGALAVLALLLWLALHFTLQRPLLRLYLSAGRLARGAPQDGPAAWEELSRPVPVHGFGGLARTGRAREAPRRQVLREGGPARAGLPGAGGGRRAGGGLLGGTDDLRAEPGEPRDRGSRLGPHRAADAHRDRVEPAPAVPRPAVHRPERRGRTSAGHDPRRP